MGIAIDVGDAIPESSDEPAQNVHHSYRRTIDMLMAATAAMRETGRPAVQPPRRGRRYDAVDVRAATIPAGTPDSRACHRQRLRACRCRRLGRRVEPVYKVPLVPLPDGGYEAVLPAGVNAFTFFWTEAPWTPGHPGHWERGPRGARVFSALGE